MSTTPKGRRRPAEAGRTKGIGVVNLKRWVVKHHGEAAWNELLESALDQGERDLVVSVVAVEWFPLETYTRLLHAIDRKLGRGDLSLIREIATFMAESDLKTIHRMLLRLASPAYIIEKTAEFWRRYHDTGTFTVTREGSNKATGILEGWAGADEALCADNLGYMKRTLELVGGSHVNVQHPRCRGRGDAVCEYVATWK